MNEHLGGLYGMEVSESRDFLLAYSNLYRGFNLIYRGISPIRTIHFAVFGSIK